MKTSQVTEDEIANAAGIGDVHNGVNFMRAAAVIAMEKAQQSFDPMLEVRPLPSPRFNVDLLFII